MAVEADAVLPARKEERVWTRVGNVSHLLAGSAAAFVLGSYGAHFMWALIVLLGVVAVEAKRTSKARRKLLAQLHREQQEGRTVSNAETVRWMNEALLSFFPQIGGFASDKVSDAVKDVLANLLETNKPPMVSDMRVAHVEFGETPPVLYKPKLFASVTDGWQWEVSLFWQNEFKLKLDLKLGMTKRLAVPMTIVAENFKVSGRLRLKIQFKDGAPPFLGKVSAAFKSDPEISVSVRPGAGGDVAHMPVLQSWIWDAVSSAVRNIMVLPNRIEVDLGAAPPPPRGKARSRRKALRDAVGNQLKDAANDQAALARGEVGDEDYELGSSDEEEEEDDDRAARAAARAAKDVPKGWGGMFGLGGDKKARDAVCGLLRVTLRRGKNLLAVDHNGVSDPYAKISLQRSSHTSATIKNTVNPEWVQDFTFPVSTGVVPILDINVFDWNAIHSDVFLGRAAVDFRPCVDNVGQRQDMTVPLLDEDLQADMKRGSIQIAITYEGYDIDGGDDDDDDDGDDGDAVEAAAAKDDEEAADASDAAAAAEEVSSKPAKTKSKTKKDKSSHKGKKKDTAEGGEDAKADGAAEEDSTASSRVLGAAGAVKGGVVGGVGAGASAIKGGIGSLGRLGKSSKKA